MFKFVLFFFTPVRQRTGHSIAVIHLPSFSRVSQNGFHSTSLFSCPHSSTPSGGNDDDTDSISGNVDSTRGAHSSPFSSSYHRSSSNRVAPISVHNDAVAA